MTVTSLRGKRTAIYARFSSELQREASIEDQVRRCKNFIVGHDGRVDESLVFTDAAISGASLQRPSVERMMRLVNEKKVDVIVAEDMSRISRDFADSANIFKQLEYLGVRLIGVGDGIDTAAPHAKMAFTMKSLMSDIYLDDLRDKTLRGLEGRARAGYSTGGLPLGYRGVPQKDAFDRVIGSRIEIDEAGAAIVRRIFELYLQGNSFEAIAYRLNAEGVPSPRAKTRHRRKGWVSSTPRAILHNAAYIGQWTFKKKQWLKVPGTNTRRYRARPDEEVMRSEHADRRIIDAETWEATQARLSAVRACYTKTADGKPKGASVPGKRTSYPLSGVMFCGKCGAPMIISGGSTRKYYSCGDAKKRGTCDNKLALREDIAKSCVLGALRDRYASPAAVMHLRKKIAEKLGELNRAANAELDERRARLARTEERIGGLIRFISDGDHSDYVRTTLKDLEVQAKTEKAAIAALLAQAAAPIALPTPEVVMDKARALERMLLQNPTRGREELRKLFENGRLTVMPQPDGIYIAESKFFPLALLTLSLDAAKEKARESSFDESSGFSGTALNARLKNACSSEGCAGRI